MNKKAGLPICICGLWVGGDFLLIKDALNQVAIILTDGTSDIIFSIDTKVYFSTETMLERSSAGHSTSCTIFSYSRPIRLLWFEGRPLVILSTIYKVLIDAYSYQPGHYLSHLIGHEGPGSLLSELKSKGWVNSLLAGPSGGSRGFDFLAIQVDLTQSGMGKLPFVVTV